MPAPDLSAVAEKLADIDIAMLSTATDGGIATRPMSNNGDVDYDGDLSTSREDTRTVADIGRDPKVALGFSGDGFWATVAGEAELIRDKKQFKKHWVADLDEWFEDGIDTEGLVLLKVSARRIKYWAGEQEDEIVLEN